MRTFSDSFCTTRHPRTAPIFVLDNLPPKEGTFGFEHLERARELEWVWGTIRQGLSPSEAQRLNARPIDVEKAMNAAYLEHLQVELARAVGFKKALVEELKKTAPTALAELADTLLELAALKNPGNLSADKKVVEDGSVVDIFSALAAMPAEYFRAPDADHTAFLREKLAIVVQGDERHVQNVNERLEELVPRLDRAYRSLMKAAEPLADTHYDGIEGMRASVQARAAFENMPIDRLYRARLKQMFIQAVDEYERTGNVDVFREAVDKTISASLRNVDGLLTQGVSRKLADGGFELQQRVIDGVHYSVRAWPDGRRKLRAAIEIEGNAADGWVLKGVPGQIRLSQAQLENLRYKLTTDGWRNWARPDAPRPVEPEVGGRICQEDGRTFIEFDIKVSAASHVGQLEGVFYVDGSDYYVKDGSSNFRGYSFAVPDGKELEALAQKLGERAA